MLSKFTTYFLKIADQERNQIWSWIVVSFLFGIIFSYSYFNHNSVQISLGLTLSASAVALLYFNRFSYRTVIYWLCLFFLLGFSWMSFYQKNVVLNRQITGKVYAQVEGQISQIKQYSHSATVIISDPKIYKAKPGKKTKKKVKKKTRKITEKQVEKSFLNIEKLQAINRQEKPKNQSFQNVDWQQENEQKIFPNPPQKVSIYIRKNADFAIGDIISFRAFLEPLKKKEFINGFDQSLYGASKKIGAYGRAVGDVEIVQKSEAKSIDQLRQKIADKIDLHLSADIAATAKALLIGQRNLISKEQLTKIRQSGLAHLLAISGLHMAIAAAIFFTSIRFLLIRIGVLNFDIKKLSAAIAIIAAYSYLQIAGSPISATRSFIMVALVLSAIVIDRKAHLKRSIALAAFVLLVINPYNAFLVSFWLSFAAILSLACFHEFISRFKPEDLDLSWLKRFLWYFAEIMLASVIVQIATAPFLIFSFKNFSSLGVFANMLAIPLTSFITMPLGFISLLAMPFGLEKLPLQMMGFSINYILQIADVISSFKFAYFQNLQMPLYAFIIGFSSWLIICLFNSKIKWIFAPIFLLSFTPLFFTKYPDISVDGQQKFFAVYNEKDGLVFSKKLRKSRKRELWMKQFAQEEFKYLNNDICDDKKCQIENPSGKILILLGRNNIKQICDMTADLIINLNARYSLPECLNGKNVIDNSDFNTKGSHFIYYKEDGFEIKTAI